MRAVISSGGGGLERSLVDARIATALAELSSARNNLASAKPKRITPLIHSPTEVLCAHSPCISRPVAEKSGAHRQRPIAVSWIASADWETRNAGVMLRRETELMGPDVAAASAEFSATEAKRHAWLYSFVLVVLTIVAYIPALRGGFIWDDDLYVTENPVIRSFSGMVSAWIPGVTPQFYPLVYTTFWLEHQLWGLHPAGYHAVNVCLHIVSSLLVWRLARALRIPGAYAIALVFALHPMHVESVAWITERKNVLSLVFYLLAAHAYLRFDALSIPMDRAAQASKRSSLYTVTLLFFVAALLSKTVTASLPVALALMIVWRDSALTLRRVLPLLPMFIVGAVAGLHTAHLEMVRVGAVGPEFDFSLIERVLIAARAILFYPAKLIVPSHLIFTYPRWEIDVGSPSSWMPLGLCLALLAGSIASFRRIPKGVVLGSLFYAVTIFPALGFANVYPMRFSFVADHFVYHASLGLIAIAIGGLGVVVTNRALARVLVAATAIALAMMTYRQGFMYVDETTLWQTTLERNPNAVVAHNNLAILRFGVGDFTSSERHSREAIRLKPDDYISYINLAQALRARGKIDEAMSNVDIALRELDRRIAFNESAGNSEAVDRLWDIKSGAIVFLRGELVRLRTSNRK